MNFIKKLLIALTLSSALFSVSVFARNNVSEIDISVTVRNDGSAYVVQNWSGEFNEGTENYIPISTKDIEISDLRVSDINGEYSYIGNWTVDADFNAKKRKCGINKVPGGVELCFGISEYGENRYAIEYVIKDFIKSYSDYDGTNFMFINPNMSTFPTDGKINIILENGTPLNQNNSAVWAFGFKGAAEFQNGYVTAYTTSSLKDENSMIVMLRLDKGIVFPSTVLNKSFEEIKNTAFEGSDYGSERYSIFTLILIFIVFFIVGFVLIAAAVFMIKRKKAIKKFYKETDYFREVPNGGNIEISHFLAQNFDVSGEKSLIIGALLLSMINKRAVEPVTEERESIFGKSKQSLNLRLIKEPDTDIEKRLYGILAAAAGEDGVLQEKELGNYSYRHPELINGLIRSASANGEAAFTALGGFGNRAGNCIKNLSEKGKGELAEVMGLKKYLDEFSLISEREVNETVIWQDYMVYAALFGIADKVINQLKKVYPDNVPEFESYGRNVVIAHSYYHCMHQSAVRAAQQARTSGMGGFSSMGGGGGFSGGGFGGGSR